MTQQDQAKKILLAEDNLVNQKVATSLLRKQGYEVMVANNGKEAVTLWKENLFDVILMDIQMPEMSGYEATQIIRETESETNVHIPIIAVTAHAMKGDREKCLEAGMDDYVTKPIHPQKLFDSIESFFNEMEMEVEVLKQENQEIYDREATLKRVGGDEGLMREIIVMFVEECPKVLEEIESAVQTQNSSALERAAHSLKGSVSNFGAKRAYEAASQLEQIARDGLIQGADQAFVFLQNEINCLRDTLQTAESQ